ncbi:hypothetical protein MPER_10695 [Moniliophthora perniciosa FA553]|nr:hypothetical protein MPER_10695 [Moniliophthora perniciosa FA553]
MPLLPFTTNDSICQNLSPRDLCRYSQINREAHENVRSYMKRAFSVYTLLSAYFTESEIDQFRILQALTGTLISGSTALQFFNRLLYAESDLDLYVEHRYGGVVANFLLAIGYNYEPRRQQPTELVPAIQKVSSATSYYDYSGRGFAGVFNFSRDDRKIQLITAKHSGMDIILGFHSTVVMNVISYSHAYCLYPEATFEKRRSMICFSFEGPERDSARQKYVDRGWKMLHPDGSEWKSGVEWDPYQTGPVATTLGSFWIGRTRHIGDAYCWSIKLPKIPNYLPDEPDDIRPAPPVMNDLNWVRSQGYGQPTPLILRERNSKCRVVKSNSWNVAIGDAQQD